MNSMKHGMTRWLWVLSAMLLPMVLAACGGGGGSASAGGGTTGALTSISFGSTVPAVAPGASLFMHAIANFADGTSQDVTIQGTWSSSNPAIATVNSGTGQVSGIAVGSVDITVSYQGVSGVQRVRVGSLLSAIDIISPANLAIGIGAQHQFNALGQFTDGARDVTGTAAWTSSDSNVATVSAGLVSGKAPGPVTITATADGVVKRVSLEVLPIQTLDARSGTTATGIQMGGLGVDGSGRALAVWNYRFATAGTPDFFYSRHSASPDWTPAAPLRTVAQVLLASAPHIAMNSAGSAVSAWHQIDGLYAATYSPSTGWAPPTKVAAQSFEDPQLQLGVGIDQSGNALLTWKADGSTALLSSLLQVGSKTWSAPVEVPGSSEAPFVTTEAKLIVSASGTATLAWIRNNIGAGASAWQLQVSRWLPGAGWQPAEPMIASATRPEFAIAANDAGDAALAWIVNQPNPAPSTQSPFVDTVASRYLKMGGGWQPTQVIAENLVRGAHNPMLAINAQAAGVLAWRNSTDYSVSVATLTASKSWSAPSDLYRPNIQAAGDPTILQPSMTDDGRALVPWIVSDITLLGQVATSRYVPGAGWDQGQMLTYTGRRGLVSGVDIRFNNQGAGAIFWLEQAGSGFNVYAKSGLSF